MPRLTKDDNGKQIQPIKELSQDTKDFLASPPGCECIKLKRDLLASREEVTRYKTALEEIIAIDDFPITPVNKSTKIAEKALTKEEVWNIHQ